MPIRPQIQTPEQRSALAAIADLRRKRDALDRVITESARQARADGCTWTAIGQACGISMQAAQQRFGRP